MQFVPRRDKSHGAERQEMNKIEFSEKVLRGDPIEWNFLTLYPIPVSKFLEFNGTKEGIVLSQQTLPMKYAGMRYLEALFALDMDAVARGEEKPGLFARCIQFLALALRLPAQENGSGGQVLPIRFFTDEADKSKLLAVEVRQGRRYAGSPRRTSRRSAPCWRR